MTTRTQDEILARFNEAAADDVLGFRREVLSEAMTLDTLRRALPDANIGDNDHTPVDIEAQARRYLDFAIGKIQDHRGISASRSVAKLAEYAWLLGRDDVVKAMDEADYAQYGAPMVKAFAEGMGWPWPAGPMLARMAAGQPCEDGCDWGCGR